MRRVGYGSRCALACGAHHPTGIGPVLLCNFCGRGAIRLFARYGGYACRQCHRAPYALQQTNQIGCKRLAACKLRLELSSLPNINEPLPPKPKWTRRRTYQRIRNEIQSLEAKAKTQKFKQPLNSQLFAFHIG